MQEIERHLYSYLLSLVIFILTLGTVVYHFVEKFSWIDAYYFSVTTLATVGYGDLVPKTTAGKLFTTFYIFSGVGIIASFITAGMHRRTRLYSERLKKNGKN